MMTSLYLIVMRSNSFNENESEHAEEDTTNRVYLAISEVGAKVRK